MSISTDLPTQLIPAPSAPPGWPEAPQVELQLGRLESLLVNRSDDSHWWEALTQQIDRVADCVGPHLAEGAPGGESDPHLSSEQRHAARELARLEAEHTALLDELSGLRELASRDTGSRGSVSLALAASTEVIAMLRGHGRRHRAMAQRASHVHGGGTP